MTSVTYVILLTLCVLYFAALSVIWIRSVPGYARWFFVFPTFGVEFVLLAAILSGAIGQDYGLRDLFWNEQTGVQVVAGICAGALVLLLFFLSFVRYAGKPHLYAASVWALDLPGSAMVWLGRRTQASAVTFSAVKQLRLFLAAMFVPFGLALLIPTALAVWHAGSWRAMRDWSALPFGAWLTFGLSWPAVGVIGEQRGAAIRPWHCWLGVLAATAAVYGLHFAGPPLQDLLTASMIICALLAVAAFASFSTYRLAPLRLVVLIGALAAYIWSSGRDPYKLTYPSLEPYYDSNRAVRLEYQKTRGMRVASGLDSTVDVRSRQGDENLLRSLNAAIMRNPMIPENYFYLAEVHRAKREYGLAITDYTKAIELDPKNARAYHYRGLARHVTKEYDQAIADFSQAIRLDPEGSLGLRRPRPGLVRGEGRLRQGHHRLQRGHTPRPQGRPGIQQLRSRPSRQEGEYDKAIADYTGPSSSTPRTSRRTTTAASPLTTRGIMTRRSPTTPRPSSSTPGMPRHATTAAMTTRTKREYDRAIADYHGPSSSTRASPRCTTTAESPNARRRNTTRPSQTTTRPSASIPGTARAYNNRGYARDDMGEYDKAIADYTRAIELDPRSATAYNNRGLAWLPRRNTTGPSPTSTGSSASSPGSPWRTSTAPPLGTTRRNTTRPSPTTTRPSASTRSTPWRTTTAASPGTERGNTTRRSPTSPRPSGSTRSSPGRTTTAATRTTPGRSTTWRSPTSTRPSGSTRSTRWLTTAAASPGMPRRSTTEPSPTSARPSGSTPVTPMEYMMRACAYDQLGRRELAAADRATEDRLRKAQAAPPAPRPAPPGNGPAPAASPTAPPAQGEAGAAPPVEGRLPGPPVPPARPGPAAPAGAGQDRSANGSPVPREREDRVIAEKGVQADVRPAPSGDILLDEVRA